jgi:Secretion system C-terminal sorting domain
MNKSFLFHSFLWCILIGMIFSVSFAQSSLMQYGPANLNGKSIIDQSPMMAPITFLDQAPNGVNGLFADSDCQLCGTLQQTVAENFIAVTGGITQLVIWGGYYPEDIPNTTDNFTIIIHSDAAGQPGAVVESRSGLQADSRVQTGVILFGTHEYIFTFDFSAVPIIVPSAGTYWLELFNNSVESGNFYWETGNVDGTHGIAGSGWFTTTPGTSWNLDPATDLSAQITGDDNPQGCPVDPPSNPSPANGATDIAVAGNTLGWTNGAGTTANEVWFDGVMVYDGSPITSYLLAPQEPLDYFTTYTWKIVCKNDSCGQSATWTFKTIQDPNLANLFCDDFTAGTGNWTITNDGGTCVWDISTLARPYTMPATATGNVFAADVDLCGSGTTLLSTATINQTFNFSGYTNSYIEFDNDWRFLQASDEAHVEVSTDGGSTWTGVWDKIGIDVRNSHEMVDASILDGQSNCKIRLRSVQPGWDWWWAVDNFCVYGVVTPVELTSFAANVNEGNVTLTWATATETNNQGFEVQRSTNGVDFEALSFVQGHGTTTETQFYSYVDNTIASGTYTYRLKQIDFNGTFEYSKTVEADVNGPKEFSLDQNYPNPFNPSTKISFKLATDSKVSLKVFDILGQEVITLINGNLVAGGHEVNFDASALNSGVYFYRIEATGVNGTNFTNVKKMILTK